MYLSHMVGQEAVMLMHDRRQMLPCCRVAVCQAADMAYSYIINDG